MFGLLAGALAGWFAFRFLRRRRSRAREEPVDPASLLRDRLSQAREPEEPAPEAEEAVGAERAATAGDVGERGDVSDPEGAGSSPTNGVPSLEDERQRVHDRARQAAERMRPNEQSD